MSIPSNINISRLWSKDIALKLLARKLGCEREAVSFLFDHAEAKGHRDELEIPDIRLR